MTGETFLRMAPPGASWLAPLLLTLSACGACAEGPDAAHEMANLKAEVARLRAENAELRLTPSALAAEVEAAVKTNDATRAQTAYKHLLERYPQSTEAADAGRRVDVLLARLRAAQEQAQRVAALGFKGLKINPNFSSGDTAIGLAATSVGKRWIFDWHGDGWKYLDAEKGRKFLSTPATVTSRSKDPALFGIAAYVADGATLKQVGMLRYRFSRWRDFGAYLGNHADFRNDFSHSARVPFTLGVDLGEDDLRRKPVYLVATREGCHTRRYERFAQPPVYYVPGPCSSLKPTLTLDDFRNGKLGVVKRID